LHQNQFGGVVAGPLSLPRLYNGHNRTFFMLSWESFRLSWGESKPGNVPSALERVGNFTKTVDNAGRPIIVKNPFSSNTPFPGNIIPASLFSPVGLNVIAQYPQADRANLATTTWPPPTSATIGTALSGRSISASRSPTALPFALENMCV